VTLEYTDRSVYLASGTCYAVAFDFCLFSSFDLMTGVSSLSKVKERSASSVRARQRLTKREQLLETAWRLFYRDGYHATGIDRILATAGVAKMTLYKHFRSKEELILAVLEKRSNQFRESFSRFLQSKRGTPERQLVGVFDWLINWVKSKEFRGCFFQKAMAEYQNLDDPIHQAALAHKAAFHAKIGQLVKAAGLARPKNLADQLALIVEGAIVSSHALGSPAPAVQAREAARCLIKTSLAQRTGEEPRAKDAKDATGTAKGRNGERASERNGERAKRE
jgi:AcrR family transcriptional regulator